MLGTFSGWGPSGLRPFCYHPFRVGRGSGKYPLSSMLDPLLTSGTMARGSLVAVQECPDLLVCCLL
jgi:hypothetical protein